MLLAGCQTLQQFANLRLVDFAINRVTDAELAGVRIDRFRDYEDLTSADLLRIGAAAARQELPFTFDLHLLAENPEENSVEARLVKLDWTLFLNDRETVSGIFDQNILIPAGGSQDIPIQISLDLVRFFDENARDLVELALAVSGQGGAPQHVRLQAVPTIETPVGPLRYPRPVTIVSRDVGQASTR